MWMWIVKLAPFVINVLLAAIVIALLISHYRMIWFHRRVLAVTHHHINRLDRFRTELAERGIDPGDHAIDAALAALDRAHGKAPLT